MKFARHSSEEVYYTTSAITTVTAEDIAFVKARAAENPRRRARLCAHPDATDPLHEMLIVHMRDIYVQPHKHLGKSESFHMIEGRLKIFLFDDEGRRTGVIEMSEPGGGAALFYRLGSSTFHSVYAQTDVIVFHEVTNGPFNPRETVWAPWAPDEFDLPGQAAFMASLAADDMRVADRPFGDHRSGGRQA